MLKKKKKKKKNFLKILIDYCLLLFHVFRQLVYENVSIIRDIVKIQFYFDMNFSFVTLLFTIIFHLNVEYFISSLVLII